jgi:hypothetical protein
MSEVRDNPAASPFEVASGGAVAFAEYRREGGDRIVLTHTEVREALSGGGAGSRGPRTGGHTAGTSSIGCRSTPRHPRPRRTLRRAVLRLRRE